MKSLQEEIGKKLPFEIPEEEALLNLFRTTAILELPFLRLFKNHNLSSSTYNVLRILRGEGSKGASCGIIRDRLIAQVPDVTRLIDRLVELGLVERDRGETDRRVVINRITVKGREALAKVDEPIRKLHQTYLGHLSRAELNELTRLLTKVRHPKNPA